MYWDVISVEVLEHLKLKVKFVDGLEGEVHCKPSHLTGVFEVLKDRDFFEKVFIEHKVVTWPGG